MNRDENESYVYLIEAGVFLGYSGVGKCDDECNSPELRIRRGLWMVEKQEGVDWHVDKYAYDYDAWWTSCSTGSSYGDSEEDLVEDVPISLSTPGTKSISGISVDLQGDPDQCPIYRNDMIDTQALGFLHVYEVTLVVTPAGGGLAIDYDVTQASASGICFDPTPYNVRITVSGQGGSEYSSFLSGWSGTWNWDGDFAGNPWDGCSQLSVSVSGNMTHGSVWLCLDCDALTTSCGFYKQIHYPVDTDAAVTLSPSDLFVAQVDEVIEFTANGTPPGGDYSWTLSGGHSASDPASNSQTVNFDNPGSYHVQVSYTVGGDTVTDCVEVHVIEVDITGDVDGDGDIDDSNDADNDGTPDGGDEAGEEGIPGLPIGP
ncbi:MAG: hypothetical protein KC917_16270, partial [Candidatus Omnitrophica bacterium]|nr:hypothetical protein [Candidatus Omnitrophota bacterium]